MRRLPLACGVALLPRSRRERDGGQHGAVRRRFAGARPDRDRHRPAAAVKRRGRAACLPPRRAVDPMSPSAATRMAGGWRASPRPSRTRPTSPSCCSATRSIRPVRRRRPRPGSPIGRRSAALSCCCRASRTRSPGSSCCGRPWASSRTPSWSPIRGSDTPSSRSSTTSSTARRHSCGAPSRRLTGHAGPVDRVWISPLPPVDRARILTVPQSAARPRSRGHLPTTSHRRARDLRPPTVRPAHPDDPADARRALSASSR